VVDVVFVSPLILVGLVFVVLVVVVILAAVFGRKKR